jgi:hypothetical protein
MNPFSELSEDNHAQVRKYLRFFRQKKDSALRAVDHEFSDTRADKLYEDMYSKRDVEELLEFIQVSTKNLVNHEISSLINMGALTVSQLLEGAQTQGLDLTLETGAIENQALLDAVEKMSLEAMPKSLRRGVDKLVRKCFHSFHNTVN